MNLSDKLKICLLNHLKKYLKVLVTCFSGAFSSCLFDHRYCHFNWKAIFVLYQINNKLQSRATEELYANSPLALCTKEEFPSEGNSTLHPLEGAMGTPSA